MNNQDLIESYPSIFAGSPSPEVSEKYKFIRTSEVLDSLQEIGWSPRQMSEVRARKPHTKGFQKHLIRLTNPNFDTAKTVGEEVPELVLTNSHNGKNSFSFRIGIYRLVCSNGLVIPTEEFSNITVKHVGNMASQIKEVIDRMSSSFPSVYADIKKMKSRKLTSKEMSTFARSASELRNPNLSKSLTVGIEDILSVSRAEDEGDDLWKVYNRIQENLMNGNFEIKTKKGARKGASIRSIDKGIKINEGLWELAKSYLG
jgi:hypothetical protein